MHIRPDYVIHTLKGILGNVLDFIVPRSPVVLSLERMGPAGFRTAVPQSHDQIPNITSLFEYRHPLTKELIRQIKFKGNESLARLAGTLLYEHLIAELSEKALFGDLGKTIIVPVPLALERLKERGFNQSERMARSIIELDHHDYFKLSNAVLRNRETKSQTKTKNRDERLHNLHGAFSVVHPDEIRGHRVIIVDDVVTTGSTLSEIRSEVLRAGARSAEGLAFAH